MFTDSHTLYLGVLLDDVAKIARKLVQSLEQNGDVLTIGACSIEAAPVPAPTIAHPQRTVEGFVVKRWTMTYSSEWGDDVSDADIGLVRTMREAMVLAILDNLEQTIANRSYPFDEEA